MDIELTRVFSEAKLRLTTARIAIFRALKESNSSLSIAQIIRLCPDIDKVSVYRTIKLFGSLNVVSVVTHGWKQSYELSSPYHPHHHHIMCENCGDVIELQSPSIEILINKLAKQYSFVPKSHHFEIYGRCNNCSSG
jgi:Fe2+ or Zn2+ uptake regulation protein